MPDPVLILGAGINGAAIARELALNGVDVVIVDARDIASGATAYSSRLIHGGLRYLEYGEFALVRESLGERTRLLSLAPQFVRPLNLFIPVRNRFGGLLSAARRFLGLKERRRKGAFHRGLWTIRFGLWLYDRYARDPSLPKHRSYRSTSPGIVPVERVRYPWVCSFYDAQIVFPERFTLALFEDARKIAQEQGSRFELHTYEKITFTDGAVSFLGNGTDPRHKGLIRPSAIVNATGAWVDLTLASLGVKEKRLMGGTKGSHFITSNRRLQEILGGRAIYTEASDGRPVFILPFFNGTLVGTTDETFDGDPGTATATPRELAYLVEAVNDVFPDLMLTVEDIDLHYAGVRPLPHSNSPSTAAITRRHWLEKHSGCDIPTYSVIGGKLTTCRFLAEETAVTILADLEVDHKANSRERCLPGSEDYPPDAVALKSRINALGTEYGLSDASIEYLWKLFGTQSEDVLRFAKSNSEMRLLDGTPLPVGAARWSIEREWATTIEDLVERRLMLLYLPNLRMKAIEELADLLVATGKLSAQARSLAIEAAISRLSSRFGKQILV